MFPSPVEIAVLAAVGFGLFALLRAAARRPAGPTAGPNAVQQVFAGCGLFVLIPLGLFLVGVGLPAWQRRALSGRPPTPIDYAVLAAVVVGYLALLLKLFRVLTTRTGAAAAAPPAAPTPARFTPRERRWIAFAVPFGVLVMAVGVVAWLVAELPGPRSAPPPGRDRLADLRQNPADQAALWVLGAGVVLTGFLMYRLNRWAYPEWWAHRNRLLYPDAAPDAKPVAAVADVPAPARDCPKCGRTVAAGSPAGLCPRCLLGGLMPSAAATPHSTIGFTEAYVAPPVEDVQKLFPHLRVERLIGQGGMGAVYLARQPALDRPVALKLVRPRPNDPTFGERFVREAKALARMNHPNVVTVYESGDAGGLPYLVMEYVAGPTLRDLMRDKALSPAAALAVIPQLCDALDYAHRQGVVHRDVKPENILVMNAESKTKAGLPSEIRIPHSALQVKIADFGLAKVADPAGVSLTGTHQAMGTPHYMAPEQWEKPGEVDHRADIYALGVVLYELLTGELPLGRFDPPSQKVRLDIRVDEVVLRALAKEPGRRYQHASDVKLELEAIRTGGGVARRYGFYEYQSKTRFLGLPLVHVVRGLHPLSGRAKTARGWLAVGDAGAVGGLAVGGAWAAGLVALSGAVSFGVLAGAGGLAVGVAALAGGGAAGLLAAFAGGFAAAQGVAAAGGFAAAVQYAAAGGGAVARWAWSSRRQDEGFWESLTDWLRFWEADGSDW